MCAASAFIERATRIVRRFALALILTISLPSTLALSDGHRMLTFCDISGMDTVVSYVAGAMERSDKDVDLVLLRLQEALERQDESSKGLKAAWAAIQGYCVPEGEVAYEAAEIFCQYLRKNPSERKKRSVDVLDAALRKAWPCSDVSKR